ncbi:hypothetical protein [Actinomadura sp. 9N215]|uniref:hypothetical protein n=1 Tax=Actinomadura sp. 9N215 TaxID=3375150 RepID=UPI0037A64372
MTENNDVAVPAEGTAEQGTGGALERAGSVLADAVTFTIVVGQLAVAGTRLAWLSESVRSTYRYVERCASGVDRLADQMAGLAVDADTVAEHHEAAAVMRSVLGEAEAMAVCLEDLSTQFNYTAEAHQGDYGTVADAANHMTVPMAEAEFYSNR